MITEARRLVKLNVVGAGRGSSRMLPRISELDAGSTRLSFEPRYIDPAPTKADELAGKARKLGLTADAVESRGEDFLSTQEPDPAAVTVVSIDDAESIAQLLRQTHDNTLFVNTILDIPGVGVTGWQLLFRPEDAPHRARFADIFGILAKVTARGGTRDVFGPNGSTANRLSEDTLRARFSDHFKRNITKAVHGLEPEDPPALVTLNRRETNEAMVLPRTRAWRSERKILSELEASLETPVRPGSNLVVVELGQDELRLHNARLRTTDRKFGLVRAPWTYSHEPENGRPPAAQPFAVLSKLSAALLAD